MRPCIAALLCALALSPAARADEIPGGHFYLGAGADTFALINAPVRLQGSTLDRAPRTGEDLSAHLDVELGRALIGAFSGIGGNSRIGRVMMGVTGGYVLTEGVVGVYAAGGVGLYGIGFALFDDDAWGGPAGIAEIGVRLPRSWQFGRATLAVSSWLPAFKYKDAWSPSLQLGLRLEL